MGAGHHEPGGDAWRAEASQHEVRIDRLEAELERARDRLHTLEAELSGLKYLAQKIGELAEEIRELATKVETVSRRALERPTSSGLSAGAGWVAVLIALAALLLTAAHH